MNRLILFALMAFAVATISTAQITIFEDFDSYQVGDNIHEVNPQIYQLWPGATVGHQISDVQAASPNNSIYLEGVGAGGPGDVIMSFRDKYDSGTASLSFNMYVEPGAGAYYNVQAEIVAGTTWASQVFFYENGTVEFQDSDNVAVASALYNQGEWFEVRYDVNLTENVWELSLDGRCLASFPNVSNSFASFNLYPIAGSSFWLDDMRFEHSPEAEEVTRDVSLVNGEEPLVGLEGNTFTNVAALFNNLGETITSAVIDVEYNGANQEITLDNINVAEGESLQLNAAPITITTGLSELAVTLRSVNGVEGDDIGCNNKLFRAVNAVSPTPRKGVLFEDATGSWCPNCPRASYSMEVMEERYGDLFVGVAVHNGDPMVVTEYDAGMSTIISGYPNVSMNRNDVFVPGNALSQFEVPFLEIIDDPIRSAFEIGAELDEATSILDVSVKVEALASLSSFDKLVFAIVEDHVSKDSVGYEQTNINAGTTIEYGGLNLLPSVIPAADMVYDDVARALLTPFGGASLEENIIPGNSKVVNFKYTLNDNWNKDNLLLTAFVIDITNRVDNAIEVPLDEALANGLSSVNDAVLQSSFEIFPNPAADLMNVKLEAREQGDVTLQLFNMFGQLVQTEKLDSYIGKQNWLVNISSLEDGMYTAKVKIGDKTAVQKVQKFTK